MSHALLLWYAFLKGNVAGALLIVGAGACGGKILIEPSIEVSPFAEAGIDAGV